MANLRGGGWAGLSTKLPKTLKTCTDLCSILTQPILQMGWVYKLKWTLTVCPPAWTGSILFIVYSTSSTISNNNTARTALLSHRKPFSTSLVLQHVSYSEIFSHACSFDNPGVWWVGSRFSDFVGMDYPSIIPRTGDLHYSLRDKKGNGTQKFH